MIGATTIIEHIKSTLNQHYGITFYLDVVLIAVAVVMIVAVISDHRPSENISPPRGNILYLDN